MKSKGSIEDNRQRACTQQYRRSRTPATHRHWWRSHRIETYQVIAATPYSFRARCTCMVFRYTWSCKIATLCSAIGLDPSNLVPLVSRFDEVPELAPVLVDRGDCNGIDLSEREVRSCWLSTCAGASRKNEKPLYTLGGTRRVIPKSLISGQVSQ